MFTTLTQVEEFNVLNQIPLECERIPTEFVERTSMIFQFNFDCCDLNLDDICGKLNHILQN